MSHEIKLRATAEFDIMIPEKAIVSTSLVYASKTVEGGRGLRIVVGCDSAEADTDLTPLLHETLLAIGEALVIMAARVSGREGQT